MKYLLDTCVLLWTLDGDKKKLGDFLEIIQNPKNPIAVSVVSYWEIAVKKSLGKLTTPDNLVAIVEDSGFTWINLETRHIAQLEGLPLLHSDPFDRLLISQAKIDGYTLLATDKQILMY